jgi:hypothetical protein
MNRRWPAVVLLIVFLVVAPLVFIFFDQILGLVSREKPAPVDFTPKVAGRTAGGAFDKQAEKEAVDYNPLSWVPRMDRSTTTTGQMAPPKASRF